MFNGRDSALNNEYISSRFLGDLTEFGSTLGNGTDRRQCAAVLDLPDPGRDQSFLDWFLINFLQERSDLGLIGLDDFLKDFLGTFISRLNAFEVQHGQAAQFTHGNGEA